MKLYFLRHGQTDWNLQKRAQGRTDNPLNETGIGQAWEAKKDIDRLQIDICFTSPLQRAKTTAEILVGDRGIPTIEEPLIIERSFGDYEGLSYGKIDGLDLRAWKDIPVPVPNGEGHLDVYRRVEKFIDKIKERYQNVLIISHNGVARCMKWYFDGFPQDGVIVKTPNCKVLEYDL